MVTRRATAAPRWVPRYLAPWVAAIEDLHAPLWLTLESLAAGLGQLIGGESQRETREAGDLDGYDGLARKGHPDTLSLSEWALADMVPEEFLRRAAERELLYLRPRRIAPRSRHALIALVDTGPDQLGGARIGQMAILLALADRARRRGVAFRWLPIGTPSPTSAQPVDGLDPGAVQLFLAARVARPWTPRRLETLRERFTADHDVWWIGAPAMIDAVEGPRVALTPVWRGDDAVLEVTVHHRAARHTATLALPPPEDCVRLLRKPFAAPAQPPAPTPAPVATRPASPPSEPYTSVTFGAHQRVFLQVGRHAFRAEHIPRYPGGCRGRAKTLSFQGTLLAMGQIGGLLAAFYADGRGHYRLRYGGTVYTPLFRRKHFTDPLPRGTPAGRFMTIATAGHQETVPGARFVMQLGEQLWHGHFERLVPLMPRTLVNQPPPVGPLHVMFTPLHETLDGGPTRLERHERNALLNSYFTLDEVSATGAISGPPAWLVPFAPHHLRCERHADTVEVHTSARDHQETTVERVTLPDGARFMGCGLTVEGGALLWCGADERTVHAVVETVDRVILRTPWPIRDWAVEPNGGRIAVVGVGAQLAAACIRTRRRLFVEGDP